MPSLLELLHSVVELYSLAELHTPDEVLSLLELLHFGEELYFSMVQCNSVLELYFDLVQCNSDEVLNSLMEQNNSGEERNSLTEPSSFYLVQNNFYLVQNSLTEQTDLNCVRVPHLFLAPARNLELQELT